MTNLTTKLPDAPAGRQAEIAADWTGGANGGGSNAPGVGINTGDYDPKVSDWARVVIDPAQSQRLGTAAESLQEPVDGNDTFAFVQADAQTAPDAVLDVATGAVNRTGKTVPAASWAWGTVPVA